jgi:hypothetical protein
LPVARSAPWLEFVRTVPNTKLVVVNYRGQQVYISADLYVESGARLDAIADRYAGAPGAGRLRGQTDEQLREALIQYEIYVAQAQQASCACGGKYADSTAKHSMTCCTRRTPGSTGYDLDVWLALTPENEAAVRAAQTPASIAAPPALDPMCCGGTAVRAECDFHRPGAA